MNTLTSLLLSLCLASWMTGCREAPTDSEARNAATGSHTHADGTTHADHTGEATTEEVHAHDETSLGTITIDGMQVELAQGHGAIAAGRESHLVVKLPYSDNGATVARAWIGTEDRTRSFVGRGEYAPSHDDYDIHAMAPDPLPANVMWWIEIEKPDGTKVIGSAKPILE